MFLFINNLIFKTKPKKKQTKLSGALHARIQQVAILEARVRDIINKFLVLREALTRQQQVRDLPPTHPADNRALRVNDV